MQYEMRSFTTERLFMRPTEPKDKPLFFSLYTDAKVMRKICPPFTEQEAEEAFNRTLSQTDRFGNKRLNWTIREQVTNQDIGFVGLTWDKAQNQPSIGVMLLRHANGKSLPEEAVGALVEYGLHYLSVSRVYAVFDKNNLASQRIVKKLGFIINTLDDENWFNSYVEQNHLAHHYLKECY
ncbi:GNAT family N-acetyltransferase [Thalassomonas haliotis]|uniref:GNAT family N-acetyltransferase n=1 Tax=Thalassomonas haliotis TaxID=485448 RepID=A0ABY7VK27_9GAMM|nr:GNAT family N-acetyltransferase [Thalassomonas haliotis]WDE13860.1 GNAT family N-acetyltransferase [Thalassomonas haliotis]